MLEHLRAIDGLPRAISEGQVLGIALHESAALHEPARRLREEGLGEVDPEAPRGEHPGASSPGATADLQDSVPWACSEQGEDATDPLALDVPDQRARMVVELLDVVLPHHLIVPRLELTKVPEGACAHRRVPMLRRGLRSLKLAL